MIKLENVSYQYKTGKMVLQNINLEIQEGECISIVGKNGTGKSTLGKLIAGLQKPTKGKIEIDELDTNEKKNFLKIREKVGIIFQNPENQLLFDHVKDEMSFGLKNLNKENIEKRIVKALKITGMKEFLDKNCYELSLGQKQRIAIAEVLSIDTKYIVLDEPTTMLDSKGKEDVYELIQKLKKQGYTIIYITNVTEEILLSDRIMFLKEGKIDKIISKEKIIEEIDTLRQYEMKIPLLLKIVEEYKKRGIQIKLEEYTEQEIIKEIMKMTK